jgi:hypothetical protein
VQIPFDAFFVVLFSTLVYWLTGLCTEARCMAVCSAVPCCTSHWLRGKRCAFFCCSMARVAHVCVALKCIAVLQSQATYSRLFTLLCLGA